MSGVQRTRTRRPAARDSRLSGRRSRDLGRDGYGARGVSGAPRLDSSVVVIEVELVRMRPQSDGIELLFALVANPRLHEILSEDAALQQKLVILFERADRFFKRPGCRADAHVFHFFAGHLIDVAIERFAGTDLVPDAIEHGDQHRRPGEVPVARGIWTADLQPLGLWAI